MSQTANVSVTEPVQPAIAYTKWVLFQPFDLGKWFIIGFCAWLAGLGQGGGGGISGNYSGIGNQSNPVGVKEQLEHAKTYLLDNLTWIIPVAVFVMLLGLVLWAVLIWLNSRGRFMFLHCVALNRAEIAEPWKKFVHAGNSLFKFQLIAGLISMVLFLPLMIWAAFLIYRMFTHGEPDTPSIVVLSAIILVFLILVTIYSVIVMFANDFIVPIMYLRDRTFMEGWRELRDLMSGNLDLFVLYVLFQIVMVIALGLIILLCVFATCCIAGCLMAIPYLGAVLLLPISIFRRTYSAFYLAQFGPDYNVFPPVAPPPPLPT